MSLWSTILDSLARLKPAEGFPDEWQLLPALHINSDGWLEGAGVEIIASHASWHYPKMSTPTGDPLAIVAHCSDTGRPAARTMARNRVAPRKPTDRAASWHASIEEDLIVQMVSFESGAWHAPSLIAGVGSANRTAVGLEAVGKPAGPWPDALVANYARVVRALVLSYAIPRARAMISHQSLDPARRHDPGPDWMTNHAPRILAYAYAFA